MYIELFVFVVGKHVMLTLWIQGSHGLGGDRGEQGERGHRVCQSSVGYCEHFTCIYDNLTCKW